MNSTNSLRFRGHEPHLNIQIEDPIDPPQTGKTWSLNPFNLISEKTWTLAKNLFFAGILLTTVGGSLWGIATVTNETERRPSVLENAWCLESSILLAFRDDLLVDHHRDMMEQQEIDELARMGSYPNICTAVGELDSRIMNLAPTSPQDKAKRAMATQFIIATKPFEGEKMELLDPKRKAAYQKIMSEQ